MRDAKKMLGLAALVATLSMTGCVSKDKYNAMVSERDSLRTQATAARMEADDYRNQLGAVTEASADSPTGTRRSLRPLPNVIR